MDPQRFPNVVTEPLNLKPKAAFLGDPSGGLGIQESTSTTFRIHSLIPRLGVKGLQPLRVKG